MKIGILSDSHGHLSRLRRAVALLVARGAEAIAHCGDIGGPECLHALGGAGVPAYAVAGNMDRHLSRLAEAARAAGVHFAAPTLLVPLGGDRFLVVTHGDNEAVLQALLEENRFPYLCHGHTHARRDQRVGLTRVLNPGALQHAWPATVMLLDTASDTVECIEVD